MTTHKEPGALGFDAFNGLPVGHIDYTHISRLQVRRGENRSALIIPGNTGTQVWHTRQIEATEYPCRVQIHDLSGAITGCAH